MSPSHAPVNAVSILYTIPVVRNPASASVLVPVMVADVFLRLLLLSVNTIAVGGVLSTVKFVVCTYGLVNHHLSI